MNFYKHILLAADKDIHKDNVSAQAKELARKYQCNLSLLHVIDDIALPDTAYGAIFEIATATVNPEIRDAQQRLKYLAAELEISEQQCWLIWGNPKQEIERFAEKINADLIVVGSHGRDGLGLLLGATANSVLNQAQCDVMAVNLMN